ncbi:MAG: AAA family ATPase [Gemmatimonadetes bacterium]|nr:AAA family ATPase [Gemmatimonadota bacterium]
MTTVLQPPEATKARRFTHLHLENWRNFFRVGVDLQRRVFLVGPNASGKSNLLDVFRFLYDVVSVGGGFQEAVRRRGGVSSLRALSARRYSDIVVLVRVSNGEPALWEYELRFTQDNLRRPIVKRERVSRNGREILVRPDEDDERDPERLTQTYLEQINVNRPFREVAEFFSSVRYLHIVPQLVREPDRSVGRKNDPFGGDFLEQLATTAERTRNARLRRIREALTVAVPQLTEVELWRDDRGTPHLRGKYEHWRPQGAWQTEELFSDGTLRLLGLLWAALDGSGPLLLEEPELSLHQEVVRFLPQMFARIQRRTGRQVLMSTHSADLLTDEGIGTDEVLLLVPTSDGTDVHLAQEFDDVRDLLAGGVPLAEAVFPRTAPHNAEQLTLFGDSE